MSLIEYYFSVNSPWTYLGHDRFVRLVSDLDIDVAIFPVDYSIIFPQTGGLPVGQRAMVRQRYRLVEMRRWSERLNKPMLLRPAHWPADDSLAASVILNCRDQPQQCMALIGAIQTAMWLNDQDIADENVLLECADTCGFDGNAVLSETRLNFERLAQVRQSESRAAVNKDVFGAPTYRYNNEIFWGQDRLELLHDTVSADTKRAIAAPSSTTGSV